ncbi:MAG TPA: Tex family protein [bacterium]|nr:Tex family protein [bacterium]
MINIGKAISEDSGIILKSVESVISLLKEGSTIPFISRYRKDTTGNLDEIAVKTISDKLEYYTELEERKETILKTIEEAGKLTPELKKKIEETTSKTELEDLYLPYKPKRKTRAVVAKELGLEPLALLIFGQTLTDGDKSELLKPYFSDEKGLDTEEKILGGAKDIIAEMISEDSEIRAVIRNDLKDNGFICSRVTTAKKEEKTKFEMYYEFKEKISEIPSHRILGMRRGEKEKVLILTFEINEIKQIDMIKAIVVKNDKNIFADELISAVEDGYKRLLFPSIETEIRVELKQKADVEAIKVFAENLKNLLLAPPLGNKPLIAVDPGIRTGSKTVVLSETGDLIKYTVLFTRNDSETEKSMKDLFEIIDSRKINYIAIGNGTGSKEIKNTIDGKIKEKQISGLYTILVNESGASVYSASEIAREEFPDVDLTVRGAASIGRRLQDPLSESVKIDPKSIGVGQYQHDVDQNLLAKELEHTVSSCVNFVGVDLNSAGVSLLQYASGINKKAAKNIIEYRSKNGMFSSREQLLEVSGIGKKIYQQCAGFLRISNPSNPLDNSAVHPENYNTVNEIAAKLNVDINNLLKNPSLLNGIKPEEFINDNIGIYTLRDIIEELKKPGRDPRENFINPNFRNDLNSIKDLEPGMVLEGVVTNITRFGAFVDIGVHQDGLLHISEVTSKYIADLNSILKLGQHLKVQIKSVDVDRNRITLSTKFDDSFVKIPAAVKSGKSQNGFHDKTNSGDKRNAAKKNKNDKPHKSNQKFDNPFKELLFKMK